MAQQRQPRESRVLVPLSWEVLNAQPVSETDFLRAVRQLPARRLLPGLISLLQYGDASEPPAYDVLDHRVHHLFPTETALRISNRLARENHWMFFSKWQLLLAIKLVCTFGSQDAGEAQVSHGQFLNFLLMVNGFYPEVDNAPDTAEGDMEAVQGAALLGYALPQYEHPHSLIGRYAELFGRLADPSRQSEFNAWVDIQNVLATKLHVDLDAFKAILFALYANSTIGARWPGDGRPGPGLGRVDPETYFAETQLNESELNRALKLVSTSPNEIKAQHCSEYGDHIGNPVDLRILLRKPVITLSDGNLAGISGQLLVQRYTCGLYWDIHDALPDDAATTPNRRTFQTFFGELHERYGRDVLQRIADDQGKAQRKANLMSEDDYESGSGSNPDGLLIETIGSHKIRCTMFEFKVGRPRYVDSILTGNVQAFQDDLRRKIEDGLDQEIDFCQHLLSGHRTIPGLSVSDISAWLFVIVVTDPFPSMGILLEPLQKKLSATRELGDAKRYGPFILSLAELEQLEMLPKSRVSQLLIDWDAGSERDWPFQSFFAKRTRGRPISNAHVKKLGDDDLDLTTTALFGPSIHHL